ncbi:MAG: transposase [Clostridia bacterium]|nr:transposase [Clostridia bacterium]
MTIDNNQPQRKNIRLKDYDYSTPGLYFVTVCTKDKKPILCRIVGTDANSAVSLCRFATSPSHREGVFLGGPKVVMFEYGKIANEQIKNMTVFYDNVKVEKYVIMPNHIHFILSVAESASGPPGRSVPTNNAISNFVGTFKRFCNKKYGKNIWQARSNDHIIRGQHDYRKIWEYIDENPVRWTCDKFYFEE